LRLRTSAGHQAPFAFWLTASVDEARNTGLAMVLICLLVSYVGERREWLPAGIVLLLLSMLWPPVFKPLARIWLGLSHVLGTIVSKIILTLLFYGLVTPIGLVRRLAGADSLQLRRWKADDSSSFTPRDHVYQAEDMDRPY
jgi:hypothetical protein